MALGYDGKLYILAFDHRGSFQKKMFGIEGDPDEEQTATITDAKRLIYEGMELAVERGVDAAATGVLIDEQFGGTVPKDAKEHGLKLAMPVEKSGQEEFDFQYESEFGDHIEQFDPDFSKVLVRYNPGGDAEMLAEQTRKGDGRENVVCVLLGRGASDDKVDHWLRQAAPVEGFIGFAIGRSIWWDALKGFLSGDLERRAAAEQIAENYLRFVEVYN